MQTFGECDFYDAASGSAVALREHDERVRYTGAVEPGLAEREVTDGNRKRISLQGTQQIV